MCYVRGICKFLQARWREWHNLRRFVLRFPWFDRTMASSDLTEMDDASSPASPHSCRTCLHPLWNIPVHHRREAKTYYSSEDAAFRPRYIPETVHIVLIFLHSDFEIALSVSFVSKIHDVGFPWKKQHSDRITIARQQVEGTSDRAMKLTSPNAHHSTCRSQTHQTRTGQRMTYLSVFNHFSIFTVNNIWWNFECRTKIHCEASSICRSYIVRHSFQIFVGEKNLC